MKKKFMLLGIIWGMVMLPAIFLMGSTTVSAQEEKLEPMELDGTQWDVEMVFVTEKGDKQKENDTLVFKEKKFVSVGFEKNGYLPTNYSLTVEEDGTTKFGTMQIKGKETAFWKGNVKDGVVDGSVHLQFEGGKTKTTYFTGKLISGVVKPKEPRPVAPVIEEEVIPVSIQPVSEVDNKEIETIVPVAVEIPDVIKEEIKVEEETKIEEKMEDEVRAVVSEDEPVVKKKGLFKRKKKGVTQE